MDPRRRATVQRVTEGSAAAGAGFRAGDEIVTLDGQPPVSIADLQWVLHRAPAEGTLRAVVRRGGETRAISLALPKGWRRRSDLSWRVTTWDLRRMGSGGLRLEDLGTEERRGRGLAEDTLALHVLHVGQYGEHATAKKAGFRKGDVLVAFDGRTDRMRETDLLAHAVTARRPGDRVPVTVLRGGKRVELRLPLR